MGILSAIFGSSKTIKDTTSLVDTLFTSKDEKLTHGEVLERIKQTPALAQVELNKVEAKHRSIFVAGWRPGVGWICALALLFHYIIIPFLNWILLITRPETATIPGIDIGDLIGILLAMLGMSKMRSDDKKSGVTHK